MKFYFVKKANKSKYNLRQNNANKSNFDLFNMKNNILKNIRNGEMSYVLNDTMFNRVGER